MDHIISLSADQSRLLRRIQSSSDRRCYVPSLGRMEGTTFTLLVHTLLSKECYHKDILFLTAHTDHTLRMVDNIAPNSEISLNRGTVYCGGAVVRVVSNISGNRLRGLRADIVVIDCFPEHLFNSQGEDVLERICNRADKVIMVS